MRSELDPTSVLYNRYPYPPATGKGKLWKRKHRQTVAEGEEIAAFLLDMAPGVTQGRILDAGCGTGLKLLGIARACPEATVIGTDVSASSLAIASTVIRDGGVNNVEFKRGDLLDPKFVEDLGAFDALVCDGVLHHLADPESAAVALAGTLPAGAPAWITLFGRLGRLEMDRVRRMVNLLSPRFIHFEQRLAVARAILTASGMISKKHAKYFEDDAFLADAVLSPRETWFDLLSARKYLHEAGFDLHSWVDGESHWGEIRKKMQAGGIRVEEVDDTLSDMERWRFVELWLAPAMLRFLAKKQG